MNAKAKRKLLFVPGLLVLCAVVGYAFRHSICVHYHRAALSVKLDYAYKLIPFGNYLRGRGINWTWDRPDTDRDVDALVQLGYLVKRDFAFIPPLSGEEFQKIHLGRPTASFKCMRWGLSNATIVAIARPDEMPALAKRIQSFRELRTATNSPTMRSSELPPAGAAGSRSP